MSVTVSVPPVETTRVGEGQRDLSLPYYEHVLEFLANGRSVQEIISYRPPAEAQQRFTELLEVNRQRDLTFQEEEELDHYVRIDRLMSLLKAKAYSHLAKADAA